MSIKPYDGKDNYIFMSYSHRDNDAVHAFVEQLQTHGYNVWFDEGIDPGTEWDENIADHIENCSYFIAYITDNYIASQNCRDEINFARDLDKDRLLIYGEDVELPKGMKMRMNRLQAIYRHKYSKEKEFYDKVFRAHGIDRCRTKAPEPQAVPLTAAPVSGAVPGGPAVGGSAVGGSAVGGSAVGGATIGGAAAGAGGMAGGVSVGSGAAVPGGVAGPGTVYYGTDTQGGGEVRKKKISGKIIALVAVLAAVLVLCLLAFMNSDTTPNDLESLVKQNPDLMESLSSDDPNVELKVKGNDIYYYYTFDDSGIDVEDDNLDVLFESVFHASDEDMIQVVKDLEEATGFTKIRLVFVGYYNGSVLFQRIWTSEGVS